MRSPGFRFDVAQLRFRHEFERSQNATGAGLRPGAARIFGSRPVRIALLVANRSGVLRCVIAKVAVCGPLDRPDCSFTTSFAIRLGSVLGFAGVV